MHFARAYPEEFGVHAGKYFNGSAADGLLKVLNNGKRIISDLAHDGITKIISLVCIPVK